MKKDFGLNVETFLGCDKTIEEARIVLFGAPLTRRPRIVPGRALPAGRCARNPMD